MRERVISAYLLSAAVWVGAVLLAPATALGYGEVVNGFPSASERLLQQLMNRARVDPTAELQNCASCGDKACYPRAQSLLLDPSMNHAARFYAAFLDINGVTPLTGTMASCTLATDIATTYPATCDGNKSCACSSATGTTSSTTRIQYFQPAGSSTVVPTGEVLASASGPEAAFNQWMFAASPANPQCDAAAEGADRRTLLTATSVSGFGSYQDRTFVGDFTTAATPPAAPDGQVRSGAPLRGQGTAVEFWANYRGDSGGPLVAMVVIDGSCQKMRLERGHARNGAWRFSTTGYTTGCARYYFYFVDHDGNAVTYPSTGTYGIGDTSCADFEATRAALPTSCTCQASCGATLCGDNGCGGFCGDCPAGQACSPAGACIDENGGGSTSGTSGTSGTTSGASPVIGAGDELAGGHLCGCATGEGSGTSATLLGLVFMAAALHRRRQR